MRLLETRPPLEVLTSGQLRPKKSQLALFGLAPESVETTRLTELIPCTTLQLLTLSLPPGAVPEPGV